MGPEQVSAFCELHLAPKERIIRLHIQQVESHANELRETLNELVSQGEACETSVTTARACLDWLVALTALVVPRYTDASLAENDNRIFLVPSLLRPASTVPALSQIPRLGGFEDSSRPHEVSSNEHHAIRFPVWSIDRGQSSNGAKVFRMPSLPPADPFSIFGWRVSNSSSASPLDSSSSPLPAASNSSLIATGTEPPTLSLLTAQMRAVTNRSSAQATVSTPAHSKDTISASRRPPTTSPAPPRPSTASINSPLHASLSLAPSYAMLYNFSVHSADAAPTAYQLQYRWSSTSTSAAAHALSSIAASGSASSAAAATLLPSPEASPDASPDASPLTSRAMSRAQHHQRLDDEPVAAPSRVSSLRQHGSVRLPPSPGSEPQLPAPGIASGLANVPAPLRTRTSSGVLTRPQRTTRKLTFADQFESPVKSAPASTRPSISEADEDSSNAGIVGGGGGGVTRARKLDFLPGLQELDDEGRDSPAHDSFLRSDKPRVDLAPTVVLPVSTAKTPATVSIAERPDTLRFGELSLQVDSNYFSKLKVDAAPDKSRARTMSFAAVALAPITHSPALAAPDLNIHMHNMNLNMPVCNFAEEFCVRRLREVLCAQGGFAYQQFLHPPAAHLPVDDAYLKRLHDHLFDWRWALTLTVEQLTIVYNSYYSEVFVVVWSDLLSARKYRRRILASIENLIGLRESLSSRARDLRDLHRLLTLVLESFVSAPNSDLVSLISTFRGTSCPNEFTHAYTLVQAIQK